MTETAGAAQVAVGVDAARPLRGAKTVTCPACEAPAGEPCRRSDTSPFRKRGGPTAAQSHRRRIELAREAAAKAEGD